MRADPEQRGPEDRPPRRPGPPGRPSTTKAGSEANPAAYGSQDSTVDFSPRLYAQPAPTPARCTAPASGPQAKESGRQSARAAPAAVRTAPAVTAPATTALVRRPTAVSRAASTASLLQPTDNCPASTAATTSSTPGPVRPAATASPPVSSVTATAGPG